MICTICNYEWQPRTQKPKACPRCKRRFDYFSSTIFREIKTGFRN